MMIGRAVPPDPAMAPSIHLSPDASNALAISLTAAASPPLVHQWVTSSSVANAAEPLHSAVAASMVVISFIISPP